MVAPVSAIWAAAPWTTVKAPSVPVVRPAEVASIVTEPTRLPVIVLVATPATAVSLPVPVTVPAPEALVKATTVELSEVTVLPAASWIVAVRTRVAPEVRLVVAPVRAMSAAAPWTTVKAPRRAGGQPGGGRFHRDGADEGAGDRLRGDAGDGGVVAGAGDGAGAGGLGEGDDSRVVGGDGVAGRVLDRGREDAVAARGEVGGRAGQEIWAAAPWTTVKAPSVPVVSPADVASIVTEPTRLTGDRLGGDAARRPCRCRCR